MLKAGQACGESHFYFSDTSHRPLAHANNLQVFPRGTSERCYQLFE